jgi:hypothetical protein|nr:MAG TPA: hypothetical protein [Caudoviricetes sp.]
MEPIINPWLIYFAGISENIQLICVLIAICTFLVAVFHFMYEEKLDKIVIIFGIIFMISGISAALMPSKETIYTIAVVNRLTPDNIDQIGKSSEDVVDYIVNKIDQIVNDSDEKKR